MTDSERRGPGRPLAPETAPGVIVADRFQATSPTDLVAVAWNGQLDPDQEAGLRAALHLVEHGVPVFVAGPAMAGGQWNPQGGVGGYVLPKGWQNSQPDPRTVLSWRPGMALCAVMGHAVDGLDVDPRNGGDEGIRAVEAAGALPVSMGTQSTPSGGWHRLVTATGARSKDGLKAGVDLKAGAPDGGRGFLFIAPTVKLSKATGQLDQYRWTELPHLDALAFDPASERLAALVAESRNTVPVRPPQTGQGIAPEYVAGLVEGIRRDVAEAVDQPDGWRDGHGRGWQKIAADAAFRLARASVSGCGMDLADAEALFMDLLEPFGSEVDLGREWSAQSRRGIQAGPLSAAPSDFSQFGLSSPAVSPSALGTPGDAGDAGDAGDTPAGLPDVPASLDDAHLAEWMARKGLEGNWAWAKGLGWLQWDGRRWCPDRADESAREAVRRAVIAVNKQVLGRVELEQQKKYTALLSTGRIGAITSLVKGVVEVLPEMFDAHPDLLNVGNGVVDLTTGQLGPHSREHHLTKITETPYVLGARHPDWDKALSALEPDVAAWMQARIGQGVTGHPTSDDVLPVAQGRGSNGKSTWLGALSRALGQHMVQVPEKLLRANPNDHPTELMTLRGARLAFIDETPEAGQLNVSRLKAVLGTESMTARAIRSNNVTWQATHSLLVATNYVPNVVETDHGTWRRLALVKFDKTFPVDGRFRTAMLEGSEGRREAVLAWVVDGARRWYANGRVLPPAPAKVKTDTMAWRASSDLVLAYLTERMVPDPSAAVAAGDLLLDFNDWLRLQGHRDWADKLLASRLGSHDAAQGVERARPSAAHPGLVRRPGGMLPTLPQRPWLWLGMRWRTETDVSGPSFQMGT